MSAIATINSFLRRMKPEGDEEQAAALAVPTTALVFFSPLELTDGSDKPKRSPIKDRVLETAALPEWGDRVNVIERHAGLLVGSMRSTAFLEPGVPVEDVDVFYRDEVEQWKADLGEFCRAADIGGSYLLCWFFIADAEGEVVSVKLMLEGSDYGYLKVEP